MSFQMRFCLGAYFRSKKKSKNTFFANLKSDILSSSADFRAQIPLILDLEWSEFIFYSTGVRQNLLIQHLITLLV